MKLPKFFCALLLSNSVFAEPYIDCQKESLSDYDSRTCESRKEGELADEIDRLMRVLTRELEKQAIDERQNPENFGVSAAQTLKHLRESHVLWKKLHELDCEIELGSPYHAGSQLIGAVMTGCMTEQYERRIGKLMRLAGYWNVELTTDSETNYIIEPE